MDTERLKTPLVSSDDNTVANKKQTTCFSVQKKLRSNLWCLVVGLILSIVLNLFLGVQVFQLMQYENGEENGVLSILTDFNVSEDVNFMWFDIVTVCSPDPKIKNLTCSLIYEEFDCFNDKQNVSFSGEYFNGVVDCYF